MSTDAEAGGGTHRGCPVESWGSGKWEQVAGGAGAPAGDLVGARREEAKGRRRSGTGDGDLTTRTRKPAPSIPPPGATSQTAGPPGASLWGAWLPHPHPPLLHWVFKRE